MKKILYLSLAALGLAAAGTAYTAMQSDFEMSLIMENVEAIAGGEISVGQGCVQTSPNRCEIDTGMGWIHVVPGEYV